MRIAVSPDYRDRHEDELREVEARAEDLDVIVSTVNHEHAEWTVKVRRGSQTLRLRGQGDLADIIHGALDDFTEAYGEPWTPDEILQVAHQSGLL